MKIKRLLAGIVACAMAVSAMAITASAAITNPKPWDVPGQDWTNEKYIVDLKEAGVTEDNINTIYGVEVDINITENVKDDKTGEDKGTAFGNINFKNNWVDVDGASFGPESWGDITVEGDGEQTVIYKQDTPIFTTIENSIVIIDCWGGEFSVEDVRFIYGDPPAEEPEGDGDDDGEEPGEDEDEVGARDPIVIDNIDHNFADGNYALSFSDYMELEDVFLIKKVTVQLTNNEYVNGTVGFTGGIDWITEDYEFADAGTHEVVADYPQDNIDEEMLDEEDWNPGLEVQQWWPKAEDNSDVLKIDSITIEFFAPGEDPAEEDPAEEDPAEEDPAEEDPAEEDPAEETETPEAKNPTTGAGGIVAAVGMSALALTAVTVSRKRK